MKELNFKSVLGSGALKLSLLFYFLIPYIIFLNYYDFSFVVDFSQLFWVLKNSIVQSAATAAITVSLSIPMSQGLLLLPDKIQALLIRLLIIPVIFPALFSVLIAFSLLNPFPMGTGGIVFLLVLVNLGFAAILTYSAIREKLGNLAVISEVYSLGRVNFYRKVFFPLLRSDIITNFFIVFILCFSSFSIPLLVGGGKGANLEVLIYEKIFVEQNWSSAFTLCVFQTLLIFFLSFYVLRNKKNKVETFSSGKYLKSYTGSALIIVYLFIYLGGYVVGVVKSLSHVDFIFQYAQELLAATLFTTRALLIYLILNFLMLFLWLIDFLKNGRFSLAINLISVSTVLVGFSFYLALPVDKNYDIIKIILAVSILFFPALFKLFLQKAIEGLQSQISIAQIYGLSKVTIIFEIIFKQISRQLWLWLSFMIVWFISEYAILRSLGVQTKTLGLLTESFLSSYRLPLSYLMSLYILVYWLVAVVMVYLILKVVYVVYKKFIY